MIYLIKRITVNKMIVAPFKVYLFKYNFSKS
jgi:hypothetical protein